MTKLIVVVLLILGVAPSSYADGSGSGSAVAPDVGSGSGLLIPATTAGSGSASTPATPAPAVHNPTTDPVGYISDLQNAKKVGWPLFILVGVFGLVELAAWLGKNVSWLAWFGKGRISVVIAGSVTVLTTMIAALADGGSWTAVLLGAAVPAIALFVHPAGTDPAKA